MPSACLHARDWDVAFELAVALCSSSFPLLFRHAATVWVREWASKQASNQERKVVSGGITPAVFAAGIVRQLEQAGQRHLCRAVEHVIDL